MPETKVQRDAKGRLLKGAVLNPGGVTEIDRTLHSEFAKLCRAILEGKDQEGKTVFERAARTLLEPIIEERSAGSPKYLVNGSVILGCLKFLTKRGYGREPDPEVEEKKKVGMIVVINAPRPQYDEPIEVKALPGAE